jgi:hypothetical protein
MTRNQANDGSKSKKDIEREGDPEPFLFWNAFLCTAIWNNDVSIFHTLYHEILNINT